MSKNTTVPTLNVTVNRDQNDGFAEVKQIGSNSKKFNLVHGTKKMANQPVDKQGMKNEASTSMANSDDASTSRQQNKDANVINTSNNFEVLNSVATLVDLGHNVKEVQKIYENTPPYYYETSGNKYTTGFFEFVC